MRYLQQILSANNDNMSKISDHMHSINDNGHKLSLDQFCFILKLFYTDTCLYGSLILKAYQKFS